MSLDLVVEVYNLTMWEDEARGLHDQAVVGNLAMWRNLVSKCEIISEREYTLLIPQCENPELNS